MSNDIWPLCDWLTATHDTRSISDRLKRCEILGQIQLSWRSHELLLIRMRLTAVKTMDDSCLIHRTINQMPFYSQRKFVNTGLCLYRLLFACRMCWEVFLFGVQCSFKFAYLEPPGDQTDQLLITRTARLQFNFPQKKRRCNQKRGGRVGLLHCVDGRYFLYKNTFSTKTLLFVA